MRVAVELGFSNLQSRSLVKHVELYFFSKKITRLETFPPKRVGMLDHTVRTRARANCAEQEQKAADTSPVASLDRASVDYLTSPLPFFPLVGWGYAIHFPSEGCWIPQFYL